MHQMILCCLLPEVKFQNVHGVGGEHKYKVLGVLARFVPLHPLLHVHSSYVDG